MWHYLLNFSCVFWRKEKKLKSITLKWKFVLYCLDVLKFNFNMFVTFYFRSFISLARDRQYCQIQLAIWFSPPSPQKSSLFVSHCHNLYCFTHNVLWMIQLSSQDSPKSPRTQTENKTNFTSNLFGPFCVSKLNAFILLLMPSKTTAPLPAMTTVNVCLCLIMFSHSLRIFSFIFFPKYRFSNWTVWHGIPFQQSIYDVCNDDDVRHTKSLHVRTIRCCRTFYE